MPCSRAANAFTVATACTGGPCAIVGVEEVGGVSELQERRERGEGEERKGEMEEEGEVTYM